MVSIILHSMKNKQIPSEERILDIEERTFPAYGERQASRVNTDRYMRALKADIGSL